MCTGSEYVDPKYRHYLDGSHRMHRDDASEIIEFVGRNSPAGTYPAQIPPYLLGQAIRRLLYNYPCDREPPGEGVGGITREFIAGFFRLQL